MSGCRRGRDMPSSNHGVETLGEQVKIRPPGALAVGGWPESAARPMMAIQ
jgi:hypothetical protein